MLAIPVKQNQLINPIQASFSKAKSTYDEHSPVQQIVGKELIKLIDRNYFNNIIDIGCGTGLITSKLYQNCIVNKFEALDFSQDFLEMAQIKNVKKNIAYHHADFDLFFQRQSNAYDLIFANMSLQWSKDFSHLLKQLYQSLNINGSLAFTIPIDGTFKELTSDYHINYFQSLKTVISLLNHQGFSIKSAFEKSYTLSFNSPIERLKSIKKTGACHFQGTRERIGKSIFKHLRTQSNTHKELYPLTYNIGLFYVSR